MTTNPDTRITVSGAPAPDSRTVHAETHNAYPAGSTPTPTQVGAPLRDASTDPHPEDFPGVDNPNNDDPMGPNVRCIEVDSPEWRARVQQLQQLQAQGKTWAQRDQS